MKRMPLVIAALLVGAALAGCDRMDSASKPADEVVATVNGQPITQAQLDIYATRRGDQVTREDLVNDLISIELLKQAAERADIHERPDVAGEIATQRSALLAQAAVRDRLAGYEITDEAINAEYERYIVEEVGEELQARHILVPSAELAQQIIAQLNEGGDFAALAAEHSQDGSAAEGGDLGWFTPGMMVQPFSEAAAALAVGAYTPEPVQTQFGFHVIKLEGRRPGEAPPIDGVRDEIRGYLQSQMVEGWVNELRGNADIDITAEVATPAGTN